MTPNPLDVDVIARRLRLLSDALHDLRSIGEIGRDRYASDPLTRAAAERLLQVVVDLAIDVNAHISAARLGRAPATGRESFSAMAEIGALSIELAGRLAPAASMRNILVHRYTDIDASIIVAAIPQTLHDFAEYVKAVSAYLHEQH